MTIQDLRYLNDKPRQDDEARRKVNMPRLVEARVEETFFENGFYMVRVSSQGKRPFSGNSEGKIVLRESIESHYLNGPPGIGDKVLIISQTGTGGDAYAVRLDKPRYNDPAYFNYEFRNLAKALF